MVLGQAASRSHPAQAAPAPLPRRVLRRREQTSGERSRPSGERSVGVACNVATGSGPHEYPVIVAAGGAAVTAGPIPAATICGLRHIMRADRSGDITTTMSAGVGGRPTSAGISPRLSRSEFMAGDARKPRTPCSGSQPTRGRYAGKRPHSGAFLTHGANDRGGEQRRGEPRALCPSVYFQQRMFPKSFPKSYRLDGFCAYVLGIVGAPRSMKMGTTRSPWRYDRSAAAIRRRAAEAVPARS